MRVSRRGFLKGLGALAITAYAPAVLAVKREQIQLLPEKVAVSIHAWVRFDGATNPPKIKDSYGVDSVIRTGKGDYTINFSLPCSSVITDGKSILLTSERDSIYQVATTDSEVGLIKIGRFKV